MTNDPRQLSSREETDSDIVARHRQEIRNIYEQMADLCRDIERNTAQNDLPRFVAYADDMLSDLFAKSWRELNELGTHEDLPKLQSIREYNKSKRAELLRAGGVESIAGLMANLKRMNDAFNENNPITNPATLQTTGALDEPPNQEGAL